MNLQVFAIWGGVVLLVPLIAPALSFGATRLVPGEFPTIQAAMDLSIAGDTVLVAPGTYEDFENRNSTTAAVFMHDGVVLKSDGGPSVTTIHLPTGAGSTLWVRFTGPGTVVDGFTITAAPDNHGILLFDQNGLVVRNCLFRDLWVNSNGAGIGGEGDLTVEDTEFHDCESTSTRGAAIGHSRGQVRLTRCTFLRCRGGGGAFLSGGNPPGSSAVVEDCVFLDNEGAGSSGIGIRDSSLGIIVRGCWFQGNVAEGDAGGLGLGGFSTKLVENCVFVNNGVTGPLAEGGAISIGGNNNAPHTVRNCTFYGNYNNGSPSGGATAEFTSQVRFENNIVAGSRGGTAITAVPMLGLDGCNVYWDNEFGPGVDLKPKDRVVDPLFCDPSGGDFTVTENSPCVEPGALGCGQIGNFGVGCGVISIRPETWSRVKALYREAEGVQK